MARSAPCRPPSRVTWGSKVGVPNLLAEPRDDVRELPLHLAFRHQPERVARAGGLFFFGNRPPGSLASARRREAACGSVAFLERPRRHQRLQLQGVEGHASIPRTCRPRRCSASTRSASATVEINNTFYRMPTAGACSRSGPRRSPDGFTFVLKAPQRITHQKRLKDVGDARAVPARRGRRRSARKRGPFLFQLPPNMKKDAPRLATFLAMLPEGVRAAFEFRARRPGSTRRRTRVAARPRGRAVPGRRTRPRTAASRCRRTSCRPRTGATCACGGRTTTTPTLDAWAERIRAQAWDGRVRLLQARGRGQGAGLREAGCGPAHDDVAASLTAPRSTVDDRLAVEAPVLDEDAARVLAGRRSRPR